jgi:hypothetical protein
LPLVKPISVPAHHGGRGAEDGEGALEVGGEDGVPFLLGHVEEHPLAEDAGDAHGSVDPAVLGERGVHDAPPARHGGDVVGDGDGLAARRDDLLDDGRRDVRGGFGALARHAVVVDDDPGPFGGAGEGDGPSDAPPGTGHGDDLACQEVPHARPLLRTSQI